MRRAAISLMVAAVAASASPTLAEAAGWPVVLPSAGYCLPAPDDPAAIAKATGAYGLGAPVTKPIAILETGVDPGARDLQGRVLPGFDAITGAALGDDEDGNGTEAAGLAAGAGPGVFGSSPTSPILPVRIFAPDRSTTPEAMAKGIAWAVGQGAGVILLGGSGKLADAPAAGVLTLSKAIDDAFTKGVLVVAAAGDDSSSDPTVPASLPHVIVAGSSVLASRRAPSSNTGPYVDLLAPAEGVTAPLPAALCDKGYGYSLGTTYAAATVAGAAAAIEALRPGLTVQQEFQLVRHAAIDAGPIGRDDDSGFGMLNVAAAKAVATPDPETTTEVDDDPYWVRGPYAAAHRPVLTARKLRFKVTGSVSPAKDPADVVPVQLVKGERMVVTLNGADDSSIMDLQVLNPSAGDFDVTNGVARSVAIGSNGLSSYQRVELTARRAGTYYIAVEAPDPVDPSDPTYVAPDLEPYQLSAFAQVKHQKKRASHSRSRHH